MPTEKKNKPNKETKSQKDKKTTKSTSSKTTTKSSGGSTEIGKITKADVVTLAPAVEVAKTTVAPVREIEATQIDKAQQEEFRKRQLQLADELAAQSRGEGPSLADLQIKSATDKNLAAQLAMARSGRAGQGALGMRAASQQMGTLQQEAAMASALARIQEQNQARALLGQVTDLGRMRDIDLATNQATLSQGANVANQGAFNQALLAQANIDAQAAQLNADLATKTNLAQGQLGQGANDAFAAALNNKLIQQANINAGIRQAGISAGAARAAAAAQAGASMYGTDAQMERFYVTQMLEEDARRQGQTQGTATSQYGAQNTLNAGRQQRDQATMNAANNAGGKGGSAAMK